jgi:hypothetical protein
VVPLVACVSVEPLIKVYSKTSARVRLIKFCIDCGLCTRCALHMARDIHTDIIIGAQQTDLDEFVARTYSGVFNESVRDLAATCVLCFGFFQHSAGAVLTLFNAAMAEHNYVGVSTFALGVTVPTATLIRSAVVAAELTEFAAANELTWTPTEDDEFKERAKGFVVAALSSCGLRFSKQVSVIWRATCSDIER